jgi:glycerophosphoryl diester phosphodiesterase
MIARPFLSLVRQNGICARILFASLTLIVFITSISGQSARTAKPVLVAHRGASGYAPEHTLAAYRLAIKQGADFVEQDLQVTKDGALVCLHDAELSRTTNAAEVFPDRATMRDPEGQGKERRGWFVADFTLAEIKRLDAGSWFNRANPFSANKSFVGERVPTLEEAIKEVGTRAGLYIEIKYFEFYRSLGHDAAAKLAQILDANGFNRRGQSSHVFVQSFSKDCLLRVRELAPHYARVQLLPMESRQRSDTSKVTPELAREIAEYAQGAGPSKNMLGSAADVETFHRAGLVIHPYTFRGSTSAVQRRPLSEVQSNGSTLRENIIADIQHYLLFGIDGGFTDYPELWKEAVRKNSKK